MLDIEKDIKEYLDKVDDTTYFNSQKVLNAFIKEEVSENDFGGGSSANGGSSEGDPLFEEAKALVLETQKASASMIQRRLSVGFNRATRLMEELEEAGVIGPAEGTKPRKVLMTQE